MFCTAAPDAPSFPHELQDEHPNAHGVAVGDPHTHTDGVADRKCFRFQHALADCVARVESFTDAEPDTLAKPDAVAYSLQVLWRSAESQQQR